MRARAGRLRPTIWSAMAGRTHRVHAAAIHGLWSRGVLLCATLCISLGLLVSCGGDGVTKNPNDSTSSTRKRGIVVISGANVTDTALAELAKPLIVEVHDSTGALAPLAAVVRFSTPQHREGPELQLRSFSAAGSQGTVVGTTDASGRTGVYIAMGYLSGPARVVVEVPTLFLRDTIRYTVTPGKAARLDFSTRDTAVAMGNTLSLSARVTDAYGNVRADPITWSVRGVAAGITSSGLVSPSDVGRVYAVAAVGSVTDSVGITVVPKAEIAAVDVRSNEIVSINLDGTSRQARTKFEDGGIGPGPRWMPGSDRIIYSTYQDGVQTLRVVDATKTSLPFLVGAPPTITHTADAAPVRTGSWVYFSAWDGRCGLQDYCLERARPDGTGIELLGYSYPFNVVTYRPTPSPDGAQVVFVTSQNGAQVFKAMDVASRTFSNWAIAGYYPQWSPLGGVIAYFDVTGGLSLVQTNGANARVLASNASGWQPTPFTWSPDAEWILAWSTRGLTLVRVATGAVLPLPYLSGYASPSWR